MSERDLTKPLGQQAEPLTTQDMAGWTASRLRLRSACELVGEPRPFFEFAAAVVGRIAGATTGRALDDIPAIELASIIEANVERILIEVMVMPAGGQG